MKRSLLIAFALLLTSGLWAAVPDGVRIENAKVRKKAGAVEVSFDIDPGQLRPNYQLTLTPSIYNESHRQTLEPVSFTGPKRKLYNARNKTSEPVNNHTVKRKKTGTVHYKTSVPYQEWMHSVSLSVDKVLAGCCAEERLAPTSLLQNRLLQFEITPHFGTEKLEYQLTELEKYSLENPFLHPVEDYPKRHDILMTDREKGTAAVNFKVGSHVIDPNIPGNQGLLEAIRKAFALILNDPNASLKQIVIAGYASPEGTLAFNTQLAQRRVDAVKEYLLRNLDMPRDESLFELHNGREDWGGLREKVAASNMEYRQEVLAIIDAYSMEQEERKTELKKLGGGKPYTYMLQNFYPTLRNAGYLQVYYDIDRTATVAEAVTDKDGRTTWIDPDSPANLGITRINRATDLTIRGDYSVALRELEGQKENPMAFNLIGVCHMMLGDHDAAETYLKKAQANGDRYAPLNLEQIGRARSVEK